MNRLDHPRRAAVVVLGLAVTTLVAVTLPDGGTLGAVYTTLFLLIAPGWCALRPFLPVNDALGVSLVVAASIAMVTLLALGLLYAEIWEPTIMTAVLALAAIVSAVHELLRTTSAGAGRHAAGKLP